MANLMQGRWHLGRFIYAGQISKIEGGGSSATPLLPNTYSIMCYDKDGLKTAEFSSMVADNPVSSIRFELISTGCGSFEIVFSELPTKAELNYGQRVDIHLFNDSRPWYSGYVVDRPAVGTTETTFRFSGFGYFDLLGRVLVTGDYPDMDVADIVRAIGVQVEEKIGIRINSSEVVRTGYTVTRIVFDGVTAKAALEQLAEFAAGYVTGVDELRRLYFKPVSGLVNEQARFWVGHHVTEFIPSEDVSDLVNYARVKGGKLNDDGTNWLATVEDPVSQSVYGIRQAVWTLPSAFSEEDAQRWGLEELNRTKDPKRSATVKGISLEYPNSDGSFGVRKLTTWGRAAIYPKDGSAPHYYPIKEVRYSVSASKGISCEGKLGEVQKSESEWISDIERKAKENELMQSFSNQQLI